MPRLCPLVVIDTVRVLTRMVILVMVILVIIN